MGKSQIYSLAARNTCNNTLHLKKQRILFEQLAGWRQLIFCLIMLLILAHLSSEMRYVTAATKMFSTEIAVSVCLLGLIIVLCPMWVFFFCEVPRLRCLVDNKSWFNVAACRVCDDLSTRRRVHFRDFRMSNGKMSSLSLNRMTIPSYYRNSNLLKQHLD